MQAYLLKFYKYSCILLKYFEQAYLKNECSRILLKYLEQAHLNFSRRYACIRENFSQQKVLPYFTRLLFYVLRALEGCCGFRRILLISEPKLTYRLGQICVLVHLPPLYQQQTNRQTTNKQTNKQTAAAHLMRKTPLYIALHLLLLCTLGSSSL